MAADRSVTAAAIDSDTVAGGDAAWWKVVTLTVTDTMAGVALVKAASGDSKAVSVGVSDVIWLVATVGTRQPAVAGRKQLPAWVGLTRMRTLREWQRAPICMLSMMHLRRLIFSRFS